MGTQADVAKGGERWNGSGMPARCASRRRSWTVEEWLTHWVENIAAPFVRENTIAGYRVAVNVHLIPGLGKHRLDRLEPEHLERLYARMIRARQLARHREPGHRTLRTALSEAVRRGH